jgi:ferrous-iron efflux pump FieF
MLASLADSALDLFASLVTLGGVHWAAQPADENHRFGHGKAEALAALFQVVVIAVSALAGSWSARSSAFRAATARHRPNRASRQHGRDRGHPGPYPLSAHGDRPDRLGRDRRRPHPLYQSDLMLNAAVIAALGLDAYAGVRGADPVFGIAIAFWLLFGAWRASKPRSIS